MPIYLKNVVGQMPKRIEKTNAAVTRVGMGFTFKQTPLGVYQVEMYKNGTWYDGYVGGRYNDIKTYFRKKYGIGVPLRKELEMAKGVNGTRVSYAHRENEGEFVNGR